MKTFKGNYEKPSKSNVNKSRVTVWAIWRAARFIALCKSAENWRCQERFGVRFPVPNFKNSL